MAAACMRAAMMLSMTSIVSSSRMKAVFDSSLVPDEDSSAAVHAQLQGSMLGPFQLRDQLNNFYLTAAEENTETGPMNNASGSLLQQGLVPVEEVGELPNGLTLGGLLGKGAFGATYEAERGGETFAVKFIYKVRPVAGGKHSISLATGKDLSLKKHLDAMSQDCDELQKFQEKKDDNPEGAKRIIKCLYKCFPGSAECPRTEEQPHFIVMEMAGQSGYKWLKANVNNKDAVAGVLNDVAQAIGYLSTTLDPPIIHHDLKWQNVVVNKVGNGWMGILIDMGTSVQASEDFSKTSSCVYTRYFAPPEMELGYCYKKPAWSFDSYGLGAMTMMGLCEVPYRPAMQSYYEWAIAAARNGFEGVVDWQIKFQLRSTGSTDAAKKCCESLAPLMHPDPEKRSRPDEIVFKNGQATRKGPEGNN